MTKRGAELREHILWRAKEVFLEQGFERTSMDGVALRAQTSKRTLYAHFENKEKLFLAVVELVRELFLSRLRTPAEYEGNSAQALTRFCETYLRALLYQASIQMLRMSMAECERFPEQAVALQGVLFGEVQQRIADFLHDRCGVSPRRSVATAEKMMASLLYPNLQDALFGTATLLTSLEDEVPNEAATKKRIRLIVSEALDSLEMA